MKRQREISVTDCIERMEREDIHQMDDFKSGLVPGMPACVEDLILGSFTVTTESALNSMCVVVSIITYKK